MHFRLRLDKTGDNKGIKHVLTLKKVLPVKDVRNYTTAHEHMRDAKA